jgi:hypothetical protein
MSAGCDRCDFFWQWTTLVYLSTKLKRKRKRKRIFPAFHPTLRCYQIKSQPLVFLSYNFPLWIFIFSYEMYFRIWESKRLMGLKIHQDSAHGLWKYWTINGKYVLYITVINHVGRFHDPRICQLYSMGSSSKVRIFVYYSCWTWKFGWSILLALCELCYTWIFVGSTIHPTIIPQNYD